MTEYKTFDDYVRCIFKIEPTELTHISPEEQKKKTVKITADELINIWNELSELKKQIEKMKRCDYMCKNYNWQGCVFSSAKETICHENKLCLFELKK